MNNVTALRRPAAFNALDAESLATGYLFQVRWVNRVSALRFCIRQLVENHEMTEEHAELAAMQADAAIEGVNQAARIDIDASTSDLVVLRTEGGYPVAFTTADLVRLLQKAREDGRTAVVDPTRERPVVLEH